MIPSWRVSFLLWTIVFAILAIRLPADAYNYGAPPEACDDMTPQHGHSPQTSQPPYTITPNATQIYGGERITLILEGEMPLEGYFIQGRDAQTGNPFGTFFSPSSVMVTCGAGRNNAVTHSSNQKKTRVAVEWEAPSNYEGGEVIFRATVVKGYVTFWTGLQSEKVAIKKRSVQEAAPLTTPPGLGNPIHFTTMSEAAGVATSLKNIYEGCSSSKTCFGSPLDCVKKENCKMLVTYTNNGNEKYLFELKGKVDPGGRGSYVAVGLSLDDRMGDDSVVVCSANNGNMKVYMSWNEERHNENVVNPTKGLKTLETGQINDDIYCKFERDKITEVRNIIFDLEKERYHVMVAEGTLAQDGALTHHTNKIVSARFVFIGETSLLTGTDNRLMKVIHGCLMIGAWVCAASCGILMARYFKHTWLGYKCCNIDQWFHCHRFFMILTWCLTMAALIIIALEVKDFEPGVHSLIGIVAIGLCFIQPFMAALRPSPTGKNRGVFNWLHWFVGNGAQILGITAIFFGFELLIGEGKNWLKEIAWYLLVAFIAFHCLIHIILSIAQCASDRTPKTSEVFPLKELTGSRMPLQPDEERPDAPGGCFRKFVLALYLPVNWCFTALLIIIVIFPREQIEMQLRSWGCPPFWDNV